MVFAIEDSPVYMLGGFDVMAAMLDNQPKVQAAFKSGGGGAWDDRAGCMSPRLGERCVVTSWRTASESRRLVAEAALFGEEENLLAVARAVWVIVDRQVQLGKS